MDLTLKCFYDKQKWRHSHSEEPKGVEPEAVVELKQGACSPVESQVIKPITKGTIHRISFPVASDDESQWSLSPTSAPIGAITVELLRKILGKKQYAIEAQGNWIHNFIGTNM